MVMREPGWELYRTFLEVMRDRSLSGAARRLAISQPTVGRHIDALEAALQLSLFSRSPRGLIPMPAALGLLPHAQTMAAAAAALARAASGEASAEHGVVRVTASEVIGAEVLPKILADFRREHPRVELELALNNRNEDLLRRDADIAVRMARPTQRALIARRIGKARLGLYAHRDYLAKFGAPKSIADIGAHRLIGFDRDDHSFRSVGPCPPRSRAKISASAATATSPSSRRCGPALELADAKPISPRGRRSFRRCCQRRSSLRWRSGSPCTKI